MIDLGRRLTRGIAVVAVAVISPSIFARQAAPAPGWLQPPRPLASPAAAGSGQPQLTTSSRGVLLSWIEKSSDGVALKFSERLTPGEWSSPRLVASGGDWFVNWADVPSVRRLSNGTLVAHWLQKSGSDSYAYDVKLSYSKDDGRTWATPFSPHNDGTKTEHGFASLFELRGGNLGVVWLDGRQMKPGHSEGHDAGDMSLRFASFGRDWSQTSDSALDSRVCECCPTSVALTADGPVVAYRDRAPGEIRDTYVTRLTGGRWTEPSPVARDNWQFPACPVNGPSVAARGRDVAVAYFQAKDGAPKSMVAFSHDTGKSFGTPIRVDSGASLGRAHLELLEDGSAAIAFIELTGTKAFFQVKRVSADGRVSQPITIAEVSNGRASGYPRMVMSGRHLVFAWLTTGGTSSVATATAAIPSMRQAQSVGSVGLPD